MARYAGGRHSTRQDPSRQHTMDAVPALLSRAQQQGVPSIFAQKSRLWVSLRTQSAGRLHTGVCADGAKLAFSGGRTCPLEDVSFRGLDRAESEILSQVFGRLGQGRPRVSAAVSSLWPSEAEHARRSEAQPR